MNGDNKTYVARQRAIRHSAPVLLITMDVAFS